MNRAIVSAELLDLNRHPENAIAGKLIELHGATYLLGERVADEPEVLVHPMRNLKSGFSWFVAKIYKCRPGSPTFEERAQNIASSSFFLELHGVRVLHSENHKIPGGLMRLQRSMLPTIEPTYCTDLMNQAGTLAKAQKWAEAAPIYALALQRNPCHAPAMCNRASCLLKQGEWMEAVQLLDAARQIEPNETTTYHLIAQAFANLGAPDMALAYLNKTLDRYRWDAPAWRMKAGISRHYGLIGVLQALLEEATRVEGAMGPFIKELSDAIAEVRPRDAIVREALGCQHSEQWPRAMTLWGSLDPRRLSALDRLNVAICKLNNGRCEEAAQEATPLLFVLPVSTRNACAAVSILGNCRCGRHSDALCIVRFLNLRVRDPIGLSSLPSVVLPPGVVIEERSSEKLLAVLLELKGKCSDDADAAAVSHLCEMYVERHKTMNRP